MRHLHLLVLLLAPVLVSAKEGYSVSFATTPDYLVAGTNTPVQVRYQMPPDISATLRLEIKAPGYHVTKLKTIKGTGTTTIDGAIPTLATARECRLTLWVGEDWQKPLAGLVHSGVISVVSPQRAARFAAGRQEAETFIASQPKGARVIGVFTGTDAPWGKALLARLRQQAKGYVVQELPAKWLGNPHALRADLFKLLVLCNPQAVPVGVKQALPRYVESGGRLIVLGALPFSRALWQMGDEWLEFDAFRERLVPKLKPTIALPFTNPNRIWNRSADDMEPPSTAKIENGALRIHVANLTGWDTFQSNLDGLTGGADACFYFRAKGDEKTTQIAVELREKDGSRWIAAVTLTSALQPTLVPLSQFRYWKDNESRDRGGPGDQVRLGEVNSISFGFAHTHTHDVRNGPHDVWIDDVGTATPGPDVDLAAFAPSSSAEPILETVSPHYKTYPVTNFARTRMNPMQALMPPLNVQPKSLRSPIARPQGTGFNKKRKFRYIPIIDALDADGRVVGAAATLLIHSEAKRRGMIAGLPIANSGFFAEPATQEWITDLALRMLSGVFLVEGGAEYYASFGGEQMRTGARIVNTAGNQAAHEIRIEVTGQAGKVVSSHLPIVLSSVTGEETQSDDVWLIPADATGPYHVTVELFREGKVIDRLAHDINIWRPNPTPSFITTRDGDFWLNGKKWYAHGVNYMPSSGIGIEERPYFEYWLDPGSYDPDIIERDLADCEAIGFNAVSIFQYHRSLSSRNLIDLLVRCRNHKLKVNLSLRPGTPMDFPWDIVREMIEKGRLAENDDIFVYDLAWEPMWRGQGHRRPYDGEWEAWVMQTHGSIAKAEQAWGVTIPRRDDGTTTNPSDEQMKTEGAWSGMVRDYHRFLNELLHTRYGRARDLVRSIDPNHGVSFRMNSAGNPTQGPTWPCYDFAGLTKAVDVMEPEGYGRIGDWERVKPGWWTAAYSRCVAPNLPVVWAEFGYSTCARSIQEATPEKLAFAENYYNDFYTMAYRSGANGTFCWWFPGGYRWNERSDYGVLNPDRSWRGITRVIKKWSKPFTTPRPLPKPNVWLEIDRKATSLGIPGFYDQTKDGFWQAVDAGKIPGLREAQP